MNLKTCKNCKEKIAYFSSEWWHYDFDVSTITGTKQKGEKMTLWHCIGLPSNFQNVPPCGLVLDIKVIKKPKGEPWHINFFCPLCGFEIEKKKAKK